MAEDVLRQRTLSAARRKGTQDKLDEMFERAFDAQAQVKCSHCGRNNPVPMPDLALLIKVIEGLEGKLPEPEQTVNHNVLVTAMSLDEKATLLETYRARARELTSGPDAA